MALSAKKFALLSMSSVLAIGLAVGGATYAIFKAEVQNGPNNVQAGTLEITSKRDDVPNVGPMFYTKSEPGNVGAMPTGFWAPGDKHTRGLFLENVGSLEARLATITATPTGNPADDALFASQAKVKIWEVKEFDPTRGIIPFTRMDGSDMDLVMDIINKGYQIWLDENPGADLTRQEEVARLLNAVNAYMLEELNKRSSSVDNRLFKVVKMYDQRLQNLVNTPFNASSYDIRIEPTKATLLGFTVELPKQPVGGVDRNALQGKEVKFTFGTTWKQVRNNPIIN